MRKIIVCTLAIFVVFVAFCHTQTDSLKVYFNINQAFFDQKIGDNALSMDSFIDKVRVAADSDDLDHIIIYGYASPDGSISINERLAKKRCEAIAAYIVKRTGIDSDLVQTESGGVAWNELRNLVAENHDVPDYDRVMEVLDNPSFDSNSSDSRKKLLMALDGGRPYRWMLRNIFPKLRYAFVVSIFHKSDSCESLTVNDASAEEPDTQETVIVTEEVDSVPVAISDTSAVDRTAEEEIPVKLGNDTEATRLLPPNHRFALKTNGLYYAALLPNIEFEWLFSDRWSAALEFDAASWGRYSKNKSYRLGIISPELRRWIKQREPWHGMYVGVFAGGGWYDFMNGVPGKYGEGYMAGISFGYMWPVSRHISLEAGIGAGYLATRYKEYLPFEGHHLYQRTKDFNYFGPLKLKFSIVWRFLERNNSKRMKSEI